MENKTICTTNVRDLIEELKEHLDKEVYINGRPQFELKITDKGIYIDNEPVTMDEIDPTWRYDDVTDWDITFDTFNLDTEDWVMPEYECDGCKHDCPACNRNWEKIEDVEETFNTMVNK